MNLLLLFQIIGCSPPNQSNKMVIPLQTCFTDPSGASFHRFHPFFLSSQGEVKITLPPFTLPHFEVPFSFPFPFWRLFIDDNYHYLPLSGSVFKYDKILSIDPPIAQINDLHIMIMRPFTFSIQNQMSDRYLIIERLISYSREIYVGEFKPISLKPYQTHSFTIYLCSTEPSTFSSILLISTSMGNIPYSITAFVSTSPFELSTRSLYHVSARYASKISIRIPNFFLKNHQSADSNANISAVFDLNLFQKTSAIKSNHLILTTKLLKEGFYVTFINFITQTEIFTLPLYISSAFTTIQSIKPSINLDIVTQMNTSVESNIYVVNPTFNDGSVLQVSFSDINVPEGLKIKTSSRQYFIPPISVVSLGKIILNVTNKKIERNSFIIARARIKNREFEHISIPIQGSVYIGNLTSSTERINIFQLSRESQSFSLKNNFEYPIAILSVYCQDQNLSIQEFLPFVLYPGEQSKNISLLIHLDKARPNFNSEVVVETNISRTLIPVLCYNGEISVSLTKHEMTANCTARKKMGKIINGSIHTIKLYLTNLNPIQFSIKDYVSSPGVSIINDASIHGFVIGSLQTETILLNVTFIDKTLTKEDLDENIDNKEFEFERWKEDIRLLKMKKDRIRTQQNHQIFNALHNTNSSKKHNKRMDIITFIGDKTEFSVILDWIPDYGQINSSILVPQPLVIGMNYTATLKVEWNFNNTINITNSVADTLLLSNENSFFFDKAQCGKNYCTKALKLGIGNWIFQDLESLHLIKPSDTSNGFKLQTKMMGWQRLFRTSRTYTFSITHKIGKNSYLKSNIPIRIIPYYFQNITVYMRPIFVGESSRSTIEISNPLAFPITFAFQNREFYDGLSFIYNKYPSKIYHRFQNLFKIASMETGHIPFSLTRNAPGNYSIVTIATSDYSPPFLVKIIGTAFLPDVKIKQPDRKTHENIVHITRRPNWKGTLYIQNPGIIPFNFSKITLNAPSRIIKMNHNCSNLGVAEECKMDIFINPKNFRNQKQPNYHITFSMNMTSFNKTISLALSPSDRTILIITRVVNNIFFSLTAFVIPVIFLLSLKNTLRAQKELMAKKLSTLQLEITRLSVSKRSSIGTQSEDLKQPPQNLRWSSRIGQMKLSYESKQFLANILNMIE